MLLGFEVRSEYLSLTPGNASIGGSSLMNEPQCRRGIFTWVERTLGSGRDRRSPEAPRRLNSIPSEGRQGSLAGMTLDPSSSRIGYCSTLAIFGIRCSWKLKVGSLSSGTFASGAASNRLVHRFRATIGRVVEHWRQERSAEEVKQVEMDEKNFLRGHNYVSVLSDFNERWVLELALARTRESVTELWDYLSESQRNQIQSPAMGIWPAFIQAAERIVPKADIFLYKFDVSKHLNEAVDTVRLQEQKRLLQKKTIH